MKDRLIELLLKHTDNAFNTSEDKHFVYSTTIGEVADTLLSSDVIVPPDELYSIIDKGTIYATVSKAIVDWLPLYLIKEPEKYGYYKTKEEAEQALRKAVRGDARSDI